MVNDSGNTRRRDVVLALGLSVLALGGCSDAMTANRYRILTSALLRGRKTQLSRNDVAKYAAASIALRIGNSAPALILLREINDDEFIFASSDNYLIAMRGGRVMQTGGLRHNLSHTMLGSTDPADGGLLTADGAKCIRLLDYAEDYGIGIEARSEFELGHKETLKILGAAIPTMRVYEHVRVKSLSWRHRNIYWAHATTGSIWKTKQHTHPDLAPLTITTLRPVRQ